MSATAAVAQEPLARADVEEIVRDYILTNPELLEEAYTILQQRRQAEQDAAVVTSLQTYRDALENSPHGAIMGNPDGDVTLVEFFDYNCGYCKRAMEDLERLIADDPNLRVVMKEFPVLGPPSVEAAAVSVLVNEMKPEAYPEFHDRLLSEGTPANPANGELALSIAEEMGLPRDELAGKLRSEAVRSAMQESYDIAKALGLSGTPAYVIGNKVAHGAVGFDELKEHINTARCGETTC
ncbi:DsbA family protein [Acuticoccus sp. MNP-M23]|uniref:DsbA family protein n=1 Tax=Acuticoccus sp. MNP-M23 TaxID=3072793 RepID=UPI00281592F9|nr:DsbA family protein [Acuticoccus sp. MNP-M23]WMS42544.1 DsbA family protein [Acuticoccus sp. MNP-M23]